MPSTWPAHCRQECKVPLDTEATDVHTGARQYHKGYNSAAANCCERDDGKLVITRVGEKSVVGYLLLPTHDNTFTVSARATLFPAS